MVTKVPVVDWLVFEVVDDPVVCCCCCCVVDDVWELLDADDDVDAPVFVLTVDDIITHVADSETT